MMKLSEVNHTVAGSMEKMAAQKARQAAEKKFHKFLAKVHVDHGNVVLESLACAIGMPVYVFIRRMASCEPFTTNDSDFSIYSFIENNLDCLDDYQGDDETQIDKPKMEPVLKFKSLKNLCMLAQSKNTFNQMKFWVQKNAGRLNTILIGCVDVEDRALSMEACYTIAFLARKFNFHMMKGLQIVIAGLVRALAICMILEETNTEIYRVALDRHTDLTTAKGRALPFHPPIFAYRFEDVHHQLIACIYYTLADILFSVPHPSLLHFYACRIFRRKEMTRTMLFHIMEAVTDNLPDMEIEAKRLCNQFDEKKDDTELLEMYQSNEWHNLPELVYTNLLRVYIDLNVVNKQLITNILNMLRTYAPKRLAIFEDDVLRALTVYNDSTNMHRISFPRNTEVEVLHAAPLDKKMSSGSTQDIRTKKQKIFNILDGVDAAIPYDDEDYDDINYSFVTTTPRNTELKRSTLIADHLPPLLSFGFSSFGL